MARWRLRDPGSFPVLFHQAMLKGEGENKIVVQQLSEKGARRQAEDFRLFRYCLRQYPSVPAARFEHELRHRTKVQYNPNSGYWELLLTSRRSVFKDIASVS